MAKYFCPKCLSLTFSLRYQTSQKWFLVGLQWCEVCKIPRKIKECHKGLQGLAKINKAQIRR